MPLCRFPLQAFTVVAVFNSMTFALKVTPLAVRALSEGAVAVKRFQVREKTKQKTPPTDLSPTPNIAVCFLLAAELLLSTGQPGPVVVVLTPLT